MPMSGITTVCYQAALSQRLTSRFQPSRWPATIPERLPMEPRGAVTPAFDWRRRAGLLGPRVGDHGGSLRRYSSPPEELPHPRRQIKGGNVAGYVEQLQAENGMI